MDKQELRERIWDELEERGEARFPFPPHGRIPNFNGAETAAERLAQTDAWKDASVIKSNPDSPQRPVRRRALEAGKTVYMAVPRLREEKCFLRLDPAEIEDIDEATTIGGSTEYGVAVKPEHVDPLDLVIVGSVVVSTAGDRIGKGEGYSDLEYAMLREYDRIDAGVPVATTVHELQVVDERFETTRHDVPLDLIATPEQLLTPRDPAPKPTGIEWDALRAEQREDIPILRHFRP